MKATLCQSIAITTLALGLSLSDSLTAPTHAATISTNKTSFESSLESGSYLETFDSLTGDQGKSENFSQNGFSYTVTNPTSTAQNAFASIYATQPSSGGSVLTTYDGGEGIRINFTSGNVTAVGGDFFLADVDGNYWTGSVSIALSDGTTAVVSSSPTTSFRGFTTADSNPITSLTLAPASYNAVDNLRVGRAKKLPEPFTILGSLIGGTAAVRMRKKLKSTAKKIE